MKYIPLSEAMRPENINDFLGQEHLLNEGPNLKKQIENGIFLSTIFWGPPGTGKTTLARIICSTLNLEFNELSAVSSSLSDVRKIIKSARNNTVALFLDEIHRFNKVQQDALLPAVESGDLLLLGATTENPSFGIIPALRSRVRLLQFKPLNKNDIRKGLKKAEAYLKQTVNQTLYLTEDITNLIILRSGGDMRKALNILENTVLSFPNADFSAISQTKILKHISDQIIKYDKNSDEHYDHASAFQKSLRGSDPDAAVYWMGKMLMGGEDPRFIARRLVITAAEDVGLADPLAVILAQNAMDAVAKIGMPEARIILTEAVLYVATAPKSNSSVVAVNNVFSALKRGLDYPVPPQLQDSHFSEAKKQGRGNGYIYPHNIASERIKYLPPELQNHTFYEPLSESEKNRLNNIKTELAKHHKHENFKKEQNIIIEWLKNNELKSVNTSDIAKDTGIPRKTVYSVLQILENKGIINIETKAEIKFSASDLKQDR